MAKIYRTTDKISYNIGELEIKVSPFSVEDKIELTRFMMEGQKGDLKSIMEGSVYAIQACVKEVHGLENADGSPYALEFENGKLSKSCAEDLLNLEQSNQIIGLCSSFIAGIPTKLPEGVSVSSPKKIAKEKK